MTIGFWTLIAAMAYGGVLFFVYSCLHVAGAAEEVGDRALLAMWTRRRGPVSARGGNRHRQETGTMPSRLPLQDFIALIRTE